MENLVISDQGGGGPSPHTTGALGRAPPPQQAQLPPQMFTTAAQLLDLTDKKLLVALRDGRKLVGILRSWDQFANLVLQSTVERIFVHPTEGSMIPAAAIPRDTEDDATTHGVGSSPAPCSPVPRGLYADIPHGVFLVRGENVLLLGEIDLDKDDDPPLGYDRAETDVVKRLAKERKAAAKEKDKERIRKLGRMGFEGENIGEVLV